MSPQIRNYRSPHQPSKWLQGGAKSTLIVCDERAENVDDLLAQLDLEGARLMRVPCGTLRPTFEPHPEFAGLETDTGTEDVVLLHVATGDASVRALLRWGTNKLEKEYERLCQHLSAGPGLALHAWLWIPEHNALFPYDPQTRDIDPDSRVRLVESNANTDVAV